ncbi:TPA: hypothetical protein RQK05_000895 [Vibrio vulnificus]|nr:hypothetical protein [Vibrio vulnificus]HDY7746309.1 hypothetical protein [Vibrio vulnificus]HDY7755904.1 hypothetical protein [Vibrio vulnificus]HDY7760321.1 hypothetical protein [Vibrio vulnificus]HDY7769444.1 hypothetical protein [Vibrio vulnificus]
MPHDVDTVLNSLLEDANSNVETRLKAMNKIVHSFKRNSVDLTVPNVVRAMEATGIRISASSFYNKTVRGKPNPYRVLFDAWKQDIDKAKVKSSGNDYSPPDFTSMTDADFATIGSDVVKFKVQTLYNELKSVRNQVNMLKQIQNLPIVQDTGTAFIFHETEESSEFVLSETSKGAIGISAEDIEEYSEAIRSFLNGNSKTIFDEDGFLIAKTNVRRGDVLSDVDFKEAMEVALKMLLASKLR